MRTIILHDFCKPLLTRARTNEIHTQTHSNRIILPQELLTRTIFLTGFRRTKYAPTSVCLSVQRKDVTGRPTVNLILIRQQCWSRADCGRNWCCSGVRPASLPDNAAAALFPWLLQRLAGSVLIDCCWRHGRIRECWGRFENGEFRIRIVHTWTLRLFAVWIAYRTVCLCIEVIYFVATNAANIPQVN